METITKEITNPIKAIRAKCLDCTCQQYKEVELCPCTQCPLYNFRFGKNPYYKKREMTEEQREKVKERMIKMQKARKNKISHQIIKE